MVRKLTKWVPALILAAILVQIPIDALAQVERHVVTIEDGKVFIDGQQVPDGDLPSSLKIKNLTASMSFAGNALLELNGNVFQLQNGRLVEADAEVARDGRVVVFFNDPTDGESVMRVLSTTRDDDLSFNGYVVSPAQSGMVMKNYYTALENKAKEFEVIRRQIGTQNVEQTVVLADRLRLEAENTARMAKAFPRVEYESYLEGIHESDASLYNQLMQEHTIETETHRLAMQARAANTDKQREQLVERLRQTLEKAFELKQENREQEIQQLSEKLSELRERIEERSDAKKRIIEARMKELLGELDW